MYFDTIDICNAHFLYAMLWHEGQFSKTYEKFAQLERIGFRPSPLLSGPEDLNDNAREIYNNLCAD